MREIWFIRHGESEANAGLATADPGTISLTAPGRLQVRRLAECIEVQPDLIIIIPYLSTLQTAEPTIEKFLEVPVETWQLHEFDYLCPEQCTNTTPAMRRPWAFEYWSRCDEEVPSLTQCGILCRL